MKGVVNLTCSIQEVDTTGKMIIEFNQGIKKKALEDALEEEEVAARNLQADSFESILDLFMEPGPYEGSD